MALLKLPFVRWAIGIALVLGLVNVLTRPNPNALNPTVDITQLIQNHQKQVIADIDAGAPQPEPVEMPDPPPHYYPTPTISPEKSEPRATPDSIAVETVTIPQSESLTLVERGFAMYEPGLRVTSAEQLRETLHTVFSYKQPSYEVVFVGDQNELALAKQYLESLEQPSYEAYPLEYASRALASFTYRMNTATGGYQITAQVQYVPVTDESRYVDQKEQEIIAKIITEDMTELQKVKAIHDWLVLNLEYDESLTRFDQYTALRDGMVVCSGYALLSYDLMERAGIRAYVITGRVYQEIHPDTPPEFLGHAWNIVRVDGIWYHYDATWDDPTPDEKGRVLYDFFLVDDAIIAQSRSIEQNDSAMLRPQTNQQYPAK